MYTLYRAISVPHFRFEILHQFLVTHFVRFTTFRWFGMVRQQQVNESRACRSDKSSLRTHNEYSSKGTCFSTTSSCCLRTIQTYISYQSFANTPLLSGDWANSSPVAFDLVSDSCHSNFVFALNICIQGRKPVPIIKTINSEFNWNFMRGFRAFMFFPRRESCPCCSASIQLC